MTEQEAIAAINTTLDTLNTATTAAAGYVTTIQERLTALLAEIAASNNSEAMTALVDRGNQLVASLTPVVTSLEQMASEGSSNPVPTPVPEA